MTKPKPKPKPKTRPKKDGATEIRIGRPEKYQAAFAKEAKQYAELGATDADISRFLGISTATLWHWRIRYPEFASALKVGKDIADERVSQSLYHRALGYSHEAVKIFANPKTGENVKVDYIEHYPPDTTACIFWLKNRRKEEWRDRSDQGQAEFTPEQLARLVTPPELCADEPGPEASGS